MYKMQSSNQGISTLLGRRNVRIQEDASLLTAFAEIAAKSATKVTCDSSVMAPYCNIQPRPRTVSDYSANESNLTPSQPQPYSSFLVEIRPRCQISDGTKPKLGYTTILRKKFSWKKYPPLEHYLIANRNEYLRHSTLNYTIQQKQYNNHLTKQMIELAAQYNLVFDDTDFSFVAIRDRIRCYYKSYVQSLKKRGILLGYAARKAGLISDKNIEISASTAGKIYLPKT